MVSPIDAGPNTVATTRDDMGPAAAELNALYLAVLGLRASGGGDEPEYCLSGITEAFRATYTPKPTGGETSGPITLFASGSQMIVITDASAKDAVLKPDVIRAAKESQTQINFLLVSNGASYSVYQEIAEATGGVVVKSAFTTGDELNILTDLASNRIAAGKKEELFDLRKRQAASEANCYDYKTSSFTSNVNGFVSTSTGAPVTVTSPDGVTKELNSNTAFNTDWPQPGQWEICAPTGVSLNANVESRTEVNFAVSFLVENPLLLMVAEETPSVCKFACMIVICLYWRIEHEYKLMFIKEKMANSDGKIPKTL